jgi:hypothetical protein
VGLRVLSDTIMMSQDYLFRVDSVIGVTMAKGSIPGTNTIRIWYQVCKSMYLPIGTPGIQFKPTLSAAPAWHCVLNCGVVEVKCPIPLEVL